MNDIIQHQSKQALRHAIIASVRAVEPELEGERRFKENEEWDSLIGRRSWTMLPLWYILFGAQTKSSN